MSRSPRCPPRLSALLTAAAVVCLCALPTTPAHGRDGWLELAEDGDATRRGDDAWILVDPWGDESSSGFAGAPPGEDEEPVPLGPEPTAPCHAPRQATAPDEPERKRLAMDGLVWPWGE